MWWRALVLLCSLSLLWVGCGDEDDDVTITGALDRAPNESPRIVDYGPAFEDPEQLIRNQFGYGESGLQLWVQVADADGVDDISTVVISVDSVAMLGTIFRPDSTSQGSCASFDYGSTDTLDLDEILVGVYPGVESAVMEQVQGGRFRCYSYLFPGLRPNFEQISEVFGPRVKNCTFSNVAFLDDFGMYPPRVAEPIDVFLTMMEIEYRGISVTVYDAAGESATQQFPDLHLVVLTNDELQHAP